MSLPAIIAHFSPCREAIDWLSTYDDPQQAWDECNRGDWILWLLGKMAGPVGSNSRVRLVKIAVACARLVPPCENIKYETVRLKCLDVIDEYCEGRVSLEEMMTAADNTYVSNSPTRYTYYTHAAYAAYTACSDHNAAINIASFDQRKCADICRIEYPEVPVFLTEKQ